MDNFETILPKLRKIDLFADFVADTPENKRILKTVYDNIQLKKFSPGEIIIKEGDFGSEFYILYEGSVQIERNTPAGDVLALASLNADMGIFFGETALISDDSRTATVKASSDVTTIVLNNKNFEKICEAEPVFGYKVVMSIARRMANTIKTTNSDKATLYAALFDEIEGLQ